VIGAYWAFGDTEPLDTGRPHVRAPGTSGTGVVLALIGIALLNSSSPWPHRSSPVSAACPPG
jgi:hypothetical protein